MVLKKYPNLRVLIQVLSSSEFSSVTMWFISLLTSKQRSSSTTIRCVVLKRNVSTLPLHGCVLGEVGCENFSKLCRLEIINSYHFSGSHVALLLLSTILQQTSTIKPDCKLIGSPILFLLDSLEDQICSLIPFCPLLRGNKAYLPILNCILTAKLKPWATLRVYWPCRSKQIHATYFID